MNCYWDNSVNPISKIKVIIWFYEYVQVCGYRKRLAIDRYIHIQCYGRVFLVFFYFNNHECITL